MTIAVFDINNFVSHEMSNHYSVFTVLVEFLFHFERIDNFHKNMRKLKKMQILFECINKKNK